MDRIWKMSLLITAIIISDQLTKGAIQQNFFLGESTTIIDGLFNLTYVRNTGAAFGMGRGAPEFIRVSFFLIVPVFACFWMIYLIWAERHRNGLLCLAYSLIFAGAVGNLIDRFTLKYVVDFLDFHYKEHHFPSFNIADAAISIAAGLLIIDYFIQRKLLKEQAKEVEQSKGSA
jgi:signal peptidase II